MPRARPRWGVRIPALERVMASVSTSTVNLTLSRHVISCFYCNMHAIHLLAPDNLTHSCTRESSQLIVCISGISVSVKLEHMIRRTNCFTLSVIQEDLSFCTTAASTWLGMLFLLIWTGLLGKESLSREGACHVLITTFHSSLRC